MSGRKNDFIHAGLRARGIRQRPIKALTVAPVKSPTGAILVGLSVHFEGGAAPLTGALRLDQARQLGELLITTARLAAASPSTPSDGRPRSSTDFPAARLEAATASVPAGYCFSCRGNVGPGQPHLIDCDRTSELGPTRTLEQLSSNDPSCCAACGSTAPLAPRGPMPNGAPPGCSHSDLICIHCFKEVRPVGDKS